MNIKKSDFAAPSDQLLPPTLCCQVVEVVESDAGKLAWLRSRIGAFVDEGDVLVFANRRAKVDELLASLQQWGAIR